MWFIRLNLAIIYSNYFTSFGAMLLLWILETIVAVKDSIEGSSLCLEVLQGHIAFKGCLEEYESSNRIKLFILWEK